MGTVNHLTGDQAGTAVTGRLNLNRNGGLNVTYASDDCARTYDFNFIVPLYLDDPSISCLIKDTGWTAENLVYKKTKINTAETGYKGTETDTSNAAFNCGTSDIKLTDKLHTHLIH